MLHILKGVQRGQRPQKRHHARKQRSHSVQLKHDRQGGVQFKHHQPAFPVHTSDQDSRHKKAVEQHQACCQKSPSPVPGYDPLPRLVEQHGQSADDGKDHRQGQYYFAHIHPSVKVPWLLWTGP